MVSLGHILNVVLMVIDDIEKTTLLLRVIKDIVEVLWAILVMIGQFLVVLDVVVALLIWVMLDRLSRHNIAEDIAGIFLNEALFDKGERRGVRVLLFVMYIT